MCTTAANRVTTCTGSFSGNHAWILNPATGGGKTVAQPPIVTAGPTTNLVSQVVHVSWANFAPTLSISTFLPETNANVGSSLNQPLELYNVAIYECSGTDPEGPFVGDGNQRDAPNCYDLTDTTQVQATAGAANGVMAFTSGNGTGQANVYVEAGPQNSFLHCGVASPCSLVVLPNWGGQDSGYGLGQPLDCNSHAADDGDTADLEVPMADYGFIGGPCSWADRIVVPLSFAPSSADCPTNATPAFNVDGSPMMEAAMEQWQAGWCTGSSPLSFAFTSEDEYLARQLFLSGSGALSANVDMALVTEPATGSNSGGASPTARHYTYAPLANSAIAFAYYVDNQKTGEPFTNLTLSARLAAKLLTESYALNYSCSGQKPPLKASASCDPAVANNPSSIFDDPGFFSLNGGNTPGNIAQFPGDSIPDMMQGGFLPTVASGNSDITYELTAWMESDPAARAFLGGQRETDGNTSMTVNKYFRNVPYPASLFQGLDPGWSVEPTTAPGQPDESIQAAWIPVSGLDNVATDLATSYPTSDNPTPLCVLSNGCVGTGNNGYVNERMAGEFLGQDAMTAVVGESQAAADAFPVFGLVNAAGKAVTPTAASILAAVSQMRTNPDGITQSPNFAGTNPAAYPLTAVAYAMVPTCGLPASTASAISAFLSNVATKGQTPGYLPGQLAPGYMPLNSHQLGQLEAAASAVKVKGQQQCPKNGGGPTGPGTGTGAAGGTGTGTRTGSSGSAKGKGARLGTTAKLSKGNSHNAGYAVKDPFAAGVGRFILPLLLIMGGILALGGPVAYVVSVTGTGPALKQRIRTLPRRVTGLVRGTWVRRT